MPPFLAGCRPSLRPEGMEDEEALGFVSGLGTAFVLSRGTLDSPGDEVISFASSLNGTVGFAEESNFASPKLSFTGESLVGFGLA